MGGAARMKATEETSVNAGGRPDNSLKTKLSSILKADLAEARREALERLRTLHPRLKPKAITERLGGAPMGGSPSWLTVSFWSEQIDLVLLAGIQGGKAGRDQAIERIRLVWPAIDAEALGQRMERLASNGLPAYLQEKFWTPEMDRILIAGLQDGTRGQQTAINRILRMHPELRVELIRNRLRQLARRVSREKARRGSAFPWTPELDAHLVGAYAHGGLAAAITEVQQETGWPRNVIGRRAHRLGIPSHEHHEQPWTAAERKFVVEHVNHQAVESIAKGLGRSEKSVRRKIEEMGLSGRSEEDYNVKRLAMDLHVRPSTIRNWINRKWLKRGRRGCIKERELATFFRNHRHELKWNELEPHIQAFILDSVRPKREKKAAQIGAAANAGAD